MIHLSDSNLLSIFFRLDCNTIFFKDDGILHSELWSHFASILQSNKKFSLILSFDRTSHYSSEIIEHFLKLRDEIYPNNLFLEVYHHSWKNIDKRLLKGGKINIVQKDMPHLSGFHFTLPNHDTKKCYLRLLGRNSINWFSKESVIKYAYDYSSIELDEIANYISNLKENYEEIFVIGANHPSSIASKNILNLASFYGRKL